MKQQNHLIYVAFGGRDYQNEVLWSLLSLFQYHPEPQFSIHIFTDDLTYLQQHVPVKIEWHPLQPEQITLWKGQMDYPYRVKIKVIQNCLQNLSGNFLYVDTDVIFRQAITPLFKAISKGSIFMDHNEGPLFANSGGIATKMKKVLRKKADFTLDNGEIITLNERFEVWNSGCIGITNAQLPSLERAGNLMDVLYATYPLFSMEQLAVTAVLQGPKLQEAHWHIHHYWYYKEFRQVIHDFLSYYTTWEIRLQNAIHWDPWILSKDKRNYKKMNFWSRTFQKIRYGYRWKNPQFNP
jgi:hypothetical protein